MEKNIEFYLFLVVTLMSFRNRCVHICFKTIFMFSAYKLSHANMNITRKQKGRATALVAEALGQTNASCETQVEIFGS